MKDKVLFLLICLTLLTSGLSAQTDKEFWFAAPQISSKHGNKPVYLRFSSFENPTKVTVSVPANKDFKPINISLKAFDTKFIDLSAYLSNIECSPDQKVLNKGIYISATEIITAYYEVMGSNRGIVVNSDIFTLKGNNGLGTQFFTPFQTHWDNQKTVNAWSSFDIVATEDNTNITITLTKPASGHEANIPFAIRLNKGECYSVKALSQLGSMHMAGSEIVSDKPVAVTLKDDSMIEGGSYDLAGDQLVPVDKIGTEYIALKGSGDFSIDRIFICATEDYTELYDSLGNISDTLMKSETNEYQLLDSATYIKSSKPIYVFHITGFGSELAGALLPSLKCSGSRRIAFTRTNDERLVLNLITRKGNENDFLLNGSKTAINGSEFKELKNTGGAWSYISIEFDTDIIEPDVPSYIENKKGDFHLAILNGSYIATGFRYGYFSDFGFLELGTTRQICPGNTVSLDAGYGKDSFLWTHSGNTISDQQRIIVSDSGWYKVQVTKGLGCNMEDSVNINLLQPVTYPILPQDTSFCLNSTISIGTIIPYSNYLWQDGSFQEKLSIKTTGIYSIEVTNEFGCKGKDSIYAEGLSIPDIEIIPPQNEYEFCKNDSLFTLSANKTFKSYLWNTGDTTHSITTKHNYDDIYWLKAININGCSNADTLVIDCSPYIENPPNLITPNNDEKNDYFFIGDLKKDKWILEIYNRWGDRVYLNKAYFNEFNADGLNDGVYFYYLKHVENKRSLKGWLQITR